MNTRFKTLQRGTGMAIALAIGIAAPLLALPRDDDDLAQNRQRLDELRREQPGRYAWLVRQAQAFRKLSKARKDQLRRLDQKLYQLPVAQRERLIAVMKRYSSWSAHRLNEGERKNIQRTADLDKKVRLVQALHEKKWIESLPMADREMLDPKNGMPEKERRDHITKLRRQEKSWRAKWRLTHLHWNDLLRRRTLPASFADFEDFKSRQDKYVKTFVEQYLRPRLTAEDWERLQNAQGNWPLFPCLLVDLADQHPIALPGPNGPSRIEDLPFRIRKRLRIRGGFNSAGRELIKRVKEGAGQWPEFGIAVAEIIDKHKLRPLISFELWPTRYEHLSLDMRGFVAEKLLPLLTNKEKLRLEMSEGRWPDYPSTIQALADRLGIEAPWQTLPGPRARWDAYRVPNYDLIEQW